MTIILTVLVGWTLLSVPASLLLGRALAAAGTPPQPALVSRHNRHR